MGLWRLSSLKEKPPQRFFKLSPTRDPSKSDYSKTLYRVGLKGASISSSQESKKK